MHFVELIELYKKLFDSTPVRHCLQSQTINELLEYFAYNFFIPRAIEKIIEAKL